MRLENTQSFEYIYNKPYNEYLPIKEIIKIFLITLFLLLKEFLKIIPQIINKDKDKYEYEYENSFIFIEFLLILLIPHSSEVYYKHQKFSFLIFTLIEIIKIIVFIIYKINNSFIDYLAIFFEIIFSIIYSFYYIYIKRLMQYKFISPYKCNFIIGIINFPLIIIIYLIISFTSLGDENNNYYYVDSTFILFKYDLDIINIIRLMILTIGYGINASLFNKIIYDFTLYHSYIPLLIEKFIVEIFYQIGEGNFYIFLISCFFIELIMILVFMEIIELNFCGFNKNLKKNIELRAFNEASLVIKDFYDDEVDNERDTIISETTN